LDYLFSHKYYVWIFKHRAATHINNLTKEEREFVEEVIKLSNVRVGENAKSGEIVTNLIKKG
jgi:hypothetical protein